MPKIITIFHETQFETLVRSEILSHGFSRPHSLVDTADLFERLPSFNVNERCSEIQSVLVVGHELDKLRAFLIFAAVAALTLGVIVGVGVVKHQVELYATIAATVYGCLAIVQVAVIWTNG